MGASPTLATDQWLWAVWLPSPPSGGPCSALPPLWTSAQAELLGEDGTRVSLQSSVQAAFRQPRSCVCFRTAAYCFDTSSYLLQTAAEALLPTA